jgi:pilus assembly protein TadC
MGLVFPILGAVGVFLVVVSLFASPRPLAATALGERLGSLSTPLFGADQASRARPLADRLAEVLFGSAGQRLGQALNRRDADELRLKLAGWPKPYTSVETLYTYKVAITIWMGVLGLLMGSAISVFLSAVAPLILPLGVVMGALGFFVPDLAVSRAASRRREHTISEMASALGRLAIFVTAGNRLPVAIREIGQRPGGPFVQELRQVAADYGVSADLEGALDAMGRRYPMPEILAFTGRMKVALQQGGSIAPALQAQAQQSREKLNLILEERAGRNTLMMLAPLGLAVMSGMTILIAPGAVMAIQMFSSGM